MGKRKKEKLRLRFVQRNGNELQTLVDSETTIGRLKDVHSMFLKVDVQNFHYKHLNSDSMIGDSESELSLKNLNIKNNDTIEVLFNEVPFDLFWERIHFHKDTRFSTTVRLSELKEDDPKVQSQGFLVSEILKELIEIAEGDKFSGNCGWGLHHECRAFFSKLSEIVNALSKGMKNVLRHEIENCLELRKEDPLSCVRLPHLVLDKILTFMIQDSLSTGENLLTFGEKCRLNEMMKEAHNLMFILSCTIWPDLTCFSSTASSSIGNIYRTFSKFQERMTHSKVLDSLKYFGVHDYSIHLSTEVVDYINSISIPDVSINFVKKSRRISLEPSNAVKMTKVISNCMDNDAARIIPVLEIE